MELEIWKQYMEHALGSTGTTGGSTPPTAFGENRTMTDTRDNYYYVLQNLDEVVVG